MNQLFSRIVIGLVFGFITSGVTVAQTVPMVSRTTTMCVATPIELCHETDHKLDCAPPNPPVKEIAESFCATHGETTKPNPYILTTLSNVSGGKCGITRYEARCKAQPMPEERKTLSMCISDGSKKCSGEPPGTVYSSCGSSVVEFGRRSCRWSDGSIAPFYVKTVKNEGGGQCGATLNQVICLLN